MAAPHIAINAQKLSTSSSYHAAGSSRYLHNLLREIRALDGPEQVVAYARKDHIPSELAPTERFRMAPGGAATESAMRRIVWEQFAFPRLLRHDGITVLHGAINALPVAWKGPSVATILDLTFLRVPEAFNRSNRVYLTWMTRFVARRADRIITISEASRQDVIHLLGADPGRVMRIYCGVDPQFKPEPDQEELRRFRTEHDLPEKFILFLATLEPRKNLVRLIDAYADLRRRGVTDWPLILAGGPGWGADTVVSHAAQVGLQGSIRFPGFVPDAELPLWYNAASLFVYPSEYEGFGLPALEALACGVPVVSSNTSSLPEVVGDAGILVDPTQTQSIADGMERLLGDEALRARLSAAGPARAAGFSWRTMAEQTVEVYRDVLRSA